MSKLTLWTFNFKWKLYLTVYYLQFWYYLLFKISLLGKLTSSNFSLSYLYNIFAIYFSSNSFFLKSYSSTKFSFYYLLTSVLSLLLNFAIAFFIFSKSFSLSHILCSAVNIFHHTKYFITPLIFLLFSIFSIFYSLTLFTSISFTFSIFCPSTCFLYLTT